jgi:hypothetical protein
MVSSSARDWNGGPCNAPGSANCFTRYYELRVQYRDVGGKQFQELKLVRVDGHDASGNPTSQIIARLDQGRQHRHRRLGGD